MRGAAPSDVDGAALHRHRVEFYSACPSSIWARIAAAGGIRSAAFGDRHRLQSISRLDLDLGVSQQVEVRLVDQRSSVSK
ncbi:hypothetical protein RPC_0928 [Rhodopseudomonas palustris BisB18]|uniref:Uncharacterized protein n=1 Tax=Rhodopseudomonas palustris (strain BisB18) TaxID=316056 RepID=Q21AT8_RHOPB